jgi:amino acid transporter
MTRKHRRRTPPADAVEAWREQLDHRYDYDYYARMGRVNPSVHAHLGIMLVFLGVCLSFAGLLSVLTTTVSLPLLAAGVPLLVAGISIIRWARRHRRNHRRKARR